MVIAFSNIKKRKFKYLKIAGTVFLLFTFSNIKKSIFTNFKTPGKIFLLILFSNIKKCMLTNCKILGRVFDCSLFKYSKKHSYESKNTDTVSCLYRFKIFKKSILINSNQPGTVFLLIPSWSIKKTYLQILKYAA